MDATRRARHAMAWLWSRVAQRKHGHIHSVTYCGHTKLVFLWPPILFGFLFPRLLAWGADAEFELKSSA